jgi:hypothetical protein
LATAPATPAPKASAGRNAAGSSATCRDGKDVNGLPCTAPGGDSSGSAAGSSSSGAAGSSSSSSGGR